MAWYLNSGSATKSDIHPGKHRWATAVLLMALTCCENQAATNPAGYIEAATGTTASMTATAETTPAGNIQTRVDDVLQASPVKEVLADLPQNGACATQQSALDTLVSTYVKQVSDTGVEPDAGAVDAFMDQVQTDVQSVVACACTNGTHSPACP